MNNNFRSIDELIQALSREKLLLKEMFAKRKTLSFRYDYAEQLTEYKTERIRYLIDYGVIRDNGVFLELEDVYLKFFEEVLEVNEELSILNRNLGAVENNLKQVREKSAYYERMNIADVLQKQEREPILASRKNSLEEKKRLLTRQYEDVAEKYRQLENELNRSLQDFKQKLRDQLIQKKQEQNEMERKAFEQKENAWKSICSRYEESEERSRNELGALKLENAQWQNKLSNLEEKRFYGKKEDACREQIHLLDLKEKELAFSREKKKNTLDKLISERDSENAKADQEYQKKNDLLIQERNSLNQKRSELEELLAKQKDSLYEWLEKNKPGWVDDIGKVVAEDSLLYQGSLEPALQPGENSFFGVRLDLEKLPVRVRTPEEIKNEWDDVLKSLDDNKKKTAEHLTELETKKSSIERAFSSKIKNFQEEIRNMDSDLVMIPVQRKRSNNELENWIRKAAEEKEREKSKIQSALADLSVKKLQAEESFEKLRQSKERELKLSERTYKAQREQAKKDYDLFFAKVQGDVKLHEQESEREQQKLLERRDEELKSKNVNIQALKDCEQEISLVQKDLDAIERNRELVFRFRKDKEELFDKEGEFKQQKKDLDSSIQNLHEKFNARRQKQKLQKSEHEKSLSHFRNQQSQMKEGIEAVNRFTLSSSCPENWKDCGEVISAKSCQEILEFLRQEIADLQKRQKELEISINHFKSRFSRRNTFKFKMELNTEEDYLEFAENLDDFILNKKYEDYRNRTSSRYTDILGRLSKEVGNVTKQKSAVEKIINDVNRDFREKNFAGVIKSIELRSQETNDSLMHLLIRIQEFYAANQYAMGDLNLFSTENSDEVNRKSVDLLMQFVKLLNEDSTRSILQLSDAFQLQFRIVENDNDTKWISKIANVGSDGTDILVKAMVNIMLINVFKREASRKFGDFKLHCMMDEIGKLHPSNVSGILQFANSRNIYLINGSPTTQSVSDYRYTYLLEKNSKSQTIVHPLITRRNATGGK